MNLLKEKVVVYTALSKKIFYAKNIICQYVIEKDFVPLNPFSAFGYFLEDRVERDLVRICNNNVVRIVDEIWSFGEVSNGVLAEIEYAMQLKKKIRLFTAGSKIQKIHEISAKELIFEDDFISKNEQEKFIDSLYRYIETY